MAATNRFRNGSNRLYTKALFADVMDGTEDPEVALYLMYGKTDKGRYLSLYSLYMAMDDPSERLFAQTYFEDYDHWMMVVDTSWAREEVARWRRELELKHRALALANIYRIASDPDHKYTFAANRFILDKGWRSAVAPEPARGKSSVGRPSKEEIKRQAEEMFNNEKDVLDDLKRLDLN